ncbi:DNA-binding transcriptional MocR family regulator [Pantoea sp. AN62]|uniref:aminotransferase-like domain-containing protein n=1 Tax=Pantoea TaxID=53335 RepID=UPI000B8021CF|nr:MULTISPECIES: PLP-dependent aminotransferase family protein [Pantoea]MCQ5472046.1 PLP-dependent aminotransferase family protein [Pantoea brenneri]MDU4747532.1 PLP-dependent aminotransferase family protein [Pantoea sp.]OXM20279.1 GntR family transcriptional regulator [Pantoea sp. AV62]HAI05402.1 PLP-dependent aminotransferase family protein [Pantoea sp.]
MRVRYKAVVDEYAAAIRNGSLPAGARLPTHRALSVDKGISLATATRVYAELEAIGLVRGETGRGTFVRDISLPAGQGIDQLALAADVLDLNFNYPSLPDQKEQLRDSMRQLAATGDLESLLRYHPHAGRKTDRDIIATWLATAGIAASADDLLIVNGAQHGLTVAVMGLLKPGDVVAVDALTYPGFKALATLYHLELVPIPTGVSGPDLTALRQICQSRRVRAIYTMPTLHNPLGWVLSHAQRSELARITREFDLLVIEDAAYAFLVSRPPPPLACYAPERTVYVTGFAKNIATGLRVGVVVSPAGMRQPLERAIRATTWNTPALMVAMVCGWIKDGTIRKLESMKRRDARQRQAIAREIMGDGQWISHASAYFIWLPLPAEVRAERILHRLMDQQISVSTAEPFSTSSNVPHAIRLALGSVSLDRLRLALTAVKETINYEKDI